MSRLHDLYLDRALEGPLALETFIDQILQGSFGPVSADEVYSFLDQVEQDMLQNIQIKAQELPLYAASLGRTRRPGSANRWKRSGIGCAAGWKGSDRLHKPTSGARLAARNRRVSTSQAMLERAPMMLSEAEREAQRLQLEMAELRKRLEECERLPTYEEAPEVYQRLDELVVAYLRLQMESGEICPTP